MMRMKPERHGLKVIAAAFLLLSFMLAPKADAEAASTVSYQVTSASELFEIAEKVKDSTVTITSITLAADIDLAAYCSSNNIQWSGIGTGDRPLTTDFEGNGYTVTLPDGGGSLINYAENVTISNLTVKSDGSITETTEVSSDADDSDLNAAGAVVSCITGGSVTGCCGLVDINVKGEGDICAGGVVGYAYGADIANCRNGGDVSAVSTDGEAYAGGVVGFAAYESDESASSDGVVSARISLCSNLGTVNSDYAGGIAGGVDYTELSSCANAGSVNATAAAGGILGKADEGGSAVSGSLNTGAVTGSSAAAVAPADVTVSGSYYDSTVNGSSDISSNGAVGVSTETLISGDDASVGSLSSGIWTFSASRYPTIGYTVSNSGASAAETFTAVMGAAVLVDDTHEVLSLSASYSGEIVSDAWSGLTEYVTVSLTSQTEFTYTASCSIGSGSVQLEKKFALSSDEITVDEYLVIFAVYSDEVTVGQSCETGSVTADEAAAVEDDGVYELPYSSEVEISYTASGNGYEWKAIADDALSGAGFTLGSVSGATASYTGTNTLTPSDETYDIAVYVKSSGRFGYCMVCVKSVPGSALEYTGSVEDDPVYDGETVEASFDIADGETADEDKLYTETSVVYYVYAEAEDGSAFGEWSLTGADDGAEDEGKAPVNAGTYKARFTGSGSTYYNDTTSSVEFTISSKTITEDMLFVADGTNPDASVDLGGTQSDGAKSLKLYDSETGKILSPVSDGDGDYSVTYGTVTTRPLTTAVVVSGEGNYTGTLSFSYRLNAGDGWSGHLYLDEEYNLASGWFSLTGESGVYYYGDGTTCFYVTDEGEYSFYANEWEE